MEKSQPGIRTWRREGGREGGKRERMSGGVSGSIEKQTDMRDNAIG